jgi:hypothetical protein
MSPAAIPEQRSPCVPCIQEQQAGEPADLTLPGNFKKKAAGAGEASPSRPLYSDDEHRSSAGSLVDRADECPTISEATPSEGGDSATESWADEPAPAAAYAPPTPICLPPAATPRPAGHPEADAHGAIQALLSLQREPSPTVPTDSPPAGCDVAFWSARAISPALLQGGISKSDSTIKFYCRFPSCGKGYASTDAVRKHCRQRHLEWLRRLGHGCPALYCRWDF